MGICAGAQQDDALTAAGICSAHDAAQVTGVSDPVEGNPHSGAADRYRIQGMPLLTDNGANPLGTVFMGDSLEDLTAG